MSSVVMNKGVSSPVVKNLKKIDRFIEEGNKAGIAQLLSEKDFRVPREALSQAKKDIMLAWVTDCACPLAVMRALALGGNPEFVFNEEDGETAIFRAIRTGCYKTFLVLIAKIVNIGLKNKGGYTPSLLAIWLVCNDSTQGWQRIRIMQKLSKEEGRIK